MEMLQRWAHQRRSHVFSTAGRSELLPANSVPEAPQRSEQACVCRYVFACVLVFVFHAYACLRLCMWWWRVLELSVVFTATLSEENLMHSTPSHLAPSSRSTLTCSICSNQNLSPLLSGSQLKSHLGFHVKQRRTKPSSADSCVQKMVSVGCRRLWKQLRAFH